MPEKSRISFSVSTIQCISCTPVFKRELTKIPGVKAVSSYVMMNVIAVDFEPAVITLEDIKKRIIEIVADAGFSGKVKFARG
jgi:copper chaperone CopZ